MKVWFILHFVLLVQHRVNKCMLEKYPSLGICVLVQFLPLSYSQGVCTWWLLHCTKRTDHKDLRDTF